MEKPLTDSEQRLFTLLTCVGKLPARKTRRSMEEALVELWSTSCSAKLTMVCSLNDQPTGVQNLFRNILRKHAALDG